MKFPRMKWQTRLAIAVLVIGLIFLGSERALADDCPALGGTINAAGECEVSITVFSSGTFTLDQTLRLKRQGNIIVGTGGITLNINGDLIMEAGEDFATIMADVTGPNQTAGPIFINTSGKIVLQGSLIFNTGAVISSQNIASSCSGIEKGGPISLKACGNINVNAFSAIISSSNCPNGADLVHLEAKGNVVIHGGVSSSGGQADASPSNQCNGTGRPLNSTACVEIWAGGTLTIDATDPNVGEIDTDVNGGMGWIDLFAKGDINIKGDTTDLFAVHANDSAPLGTGGLITLKSTEGNVVASHFAIQANAKGAGGGGGTINVEAKLDVDLTGGKLEARGATSGVNPDGGHIAIRSFGTVSPLGSILSDASSVIDVTGGSPSPEGTILFSECGTIGFQGTVFPSGVSPTQSTGVCGGAPTVPNNVFQFPGCVATARLTVTKTLVPANDSGKFNLQIDGNTAGTGTNVGNGGTTGQITLNAGSHTVGEIASTGTNLSDYTTEIGGDCNSSGSITLAAGDNKTCTITNTRKAAPLTAKLTVTKILAPTNDTGKFNLQIDGVTKASNVGNAGTTGPIDLGAGNHTVGETAGTGADPANYTTTFGGACDANGNVTLVAGDSKTCTITNTRKAKLIIIKHVINDNGGTASAGNFTMTVTGTAVPGGSTSFPGSESPGTTLALNAGTYSVGETGSNGYLRSDTAYCSGTLTAGAIKTCTVTNNDVAPKLIVKKHVINDNGGTKLAGNFTIKVTGGSPSLTSFAGSESGTTVTLRGGGYSVDEAAVSGYAKTLSAECSGTIAIGETKTCTITNDDIAPQITVINHVVNDNGGTAKAENFTMTASGTAVQGGTTSFPGTEAGTMVTLKAGAYTVGESGPSGYNQSFTASCSGTIGIGETRTCTFTNNDLGLTSPCFTAARFPATPGYFDLDTGTEFVITKKWNRPAGTFSYSKTLRIASGGVIYYGPNEPKYLTIQVNGDVIIDKGGKIYSYPSPSDCPNGQNLRIVATGKIVINGEVSSRGINGNYPGGGGTITLIAEGGTIDNVGITVGSTGVVLSSGPGGGGRVLLAACKDINILGQVSSGNKDYGATIEVFSLQGKVNIDATTILKPCLNASLSTSWGGNQSVTVQSRGDIAITGKKGVSDPFAIEAWVGGKTSATGGTVLLRSSEGAVIFNDRAIKANDTAANSRGGVITVESAQSISINGLIENKGGTDGSNSKKAIVSLQSASSNIDITPINILRIDAGPGYPGKSYDPQVILKAGGLINGDSATTIKPHLLANIEEGLPTSPPVLVLPPEI